MAVAIFRPGEAEKSITGWGSILSSLRNMYRLILCRLHSAQGQNLDLDQGSRNTHAGELSRLHALGEVSGSSARWLSDVRQQYR